MEVRVAGLLALIFSNAGPAVAFRVKVPNNTSEAPPCGTLPIKNCERDHCKLHVIREDKYLNTWCIPVCEKASADPSLCEAPWCTWHESQCLPWNAAPFLTIDQVIFVHAKKKRAKKSPSYTVPSDTVEYPAPRLFDDTPVGFRIPSMPCGPAVGEITKTYIDSHYGNDWSTYWPPEERMRLPFNGHLLALNGCERCSVFDTYKYYTDTQEAHDYFVNAMPSNEIVVTCRRQDGCKSPNFWVAQYVSTSPESFCHPCPAECLECEYKTRISPTQDRTFKCVVKGETGPVPAGYGCKKVEKRDNHDGYKARCKVRYFYLAKAGTDAKKKLTPRDGRLLIA